MPGISYNNNTPILLFDSLEEKICFLETLECHPAKDLYNHSYFEIDDTSLKDLPLETIKYINKKRIYKMESGNYISSGKASEFGSFLVPFAIKDNIIQLQECRNINNNIRNHSNNLFLFSELIRRIYKEPVVFK
jgi:hypothetical protein